MIHIKSPEEGAALFKALGSDIRIAIVKILLEEPDMSMNELAGRLNITAGALTGHVKRLEECGVLKVSTEGAGHGNVKRCCVALDKILIDFRPELRKKNAWQVSLKVGAVFRLRDLAHLRHGFEGRADRRDGRCAVFFPSVPFRGGYSLAGTGLCGIHRSMLPASGQPDRRPDHICGAFQ